MANERKLISFDWAMKRLLRSKANFAVLEGFLSELLMRDITIEWVLESESNKDSAYDKLNRVDLLVRDRERGFVIIEVQYEREVDYFLKNETLPPDSTAKGLREAEKALDILKLSGKERLAYNEYKSAQHYKASMVEYTVKELEEERRKKEEALQREDEERRKNEMLINVLRDQGLGDTEIQAILSKTQNLA